MAKHRLICEVHGCGKKHQAQGFCEPHYRRFKKYGDPHGGGTKFGALQAAVHEYAKFTGDECVAWPFACQPNGRGRIKFRGKYTNAARAVCILAHGGPPTEDHQTAHSCGNGHLGCINPRHLRWATPEENQRERALHGRPHKLQERKLTAEIVRRLRAERPNADAAAREIGVTPETIRNAVYGRTWRSVK